MTRPNSNDASADNAPRPLARVAVLADSQFVAGWQAACIEEAAEAGLATFVGVIVNASQTPAARRDLSQSTWNVLDRLERNVAVRRRVPGWNRPIDVDEQVDLHALVGDVPFLEVMPEASPSGLVHRFSPTDLEAVRSLDADILLRFGFNILRGGILQAARAGIWSFHHGDHRSNRGAVPGLYEIVNGDEYTGLVLQQLTPELDNGVVIRRARSATITRSWNLNRRHIYARSPWLLVDALRELRNSGSVRPVEERRPFELYDRPMYRKPTTGRALTAACTVAASSLSHRRRFRSKEQRWSLLVHRGPLEGASMWRMRELAAPDGRFWADPFVVEHDGEHHVFLEEFDFGVGRGRIVTGRLVEDQLAEVQPVLDFDTHLSYPCVFDLGGELHMIPETSARGTIELWVCEDFPGTWSHRRTLMSDVSAVDSTPYFSDGVWYLFTNIDRSGGDDHGNELHLFMTDDLADGALERHPASPIVTDAFTARMAGSLRHDHLGRLIRPAQIGGELYGSGLAFMHVEELSPSQYREVTAETIRPRWDGPIESLHHVSSTGDLTVFDVARWERRSSSRS